MMGFRCMRTYLLLFALLLLLIPTEPYYSSVKLHPRVSRMPLFGRLPDSRVTGPTGSSSRRSFTKAGTVAAITSLLVPFNPLQSVAAEEALALYKSPALGFTVLYPSDWERTTQTLSDRRTIELFVPPNIPGTSFFASVTPVRDDYTALSSFGSLDQFGQAGVLPKGSLQGTGVNSTMVSSAAANNNYYYTYTVSQPGEPERRLYSVFSLMPTAQDAAGMNLVSITGQCFEDDVARTGGTLEAIIASFKQK
mmetsp:Transcript_26954/g.53769  ORF Transcript_26954/g.53769 Transcript_26954/m.53769 type:complete len:251 (+) Transcript_26954:57-809(+)